MPSATLAAPSPVSVALSEIETLAKNYAAARAAVAARTVVLNDEVQSIYRRKIPGIKSCAAEAADCQAQLVAAIEKHPELFTKPRTMTINGIKLGFQKGKGGLTAVDIDDTVAKIEKLFGDEAETYLIVKKTLRASSLITLDGATLKKLGCTIDDTSDFVFVKAADSEVDKLVAKILKEGAVEEVEAS